jgi:hypothetical protein
MTYTVLTEKQKLAALALRFYQNFQWAPIAGDYYTTSRNDLELYQIVEEDETHYHTSYLPLGGATAKWLKSEFTTQGFGVHRVFVPPFVLEGRI